MMRVFQHWRLPALVIGAAAWAGIPWVLGSDYYVSFFVFAALYSLPILGLTIVFGMANQMSVAQAAFYGLGAYATGYLTRDRGVPIIVGLAVATVLPGVIAYLLGRPVLRLRHLYLAMATLAIGEILSVLFGQLGSFTGGYTGLTGIPLFYIGPWPLDTPAKYYYLASGIAITCFLIVARIRRSPFGRGLNTIRASEAAAATMGINVAQQKAMAFAASAGLAGLGGGLYAHFIGYISPDSFTTYASITFIIMLYLGGIRSIWGAALGATFLAVVPQLFAVTQHVDTLLYGAVLVLILVTLPGGLAGLASSAWKRLRMGERFARAFPVLAAEGDLARHA